MGARLHQIARRCAAGTARCLPVRTDRKYKCQSYLRITTYLSKRQLLAAAEERVRIRQQRLNLLVHRSHPLLSLGLLLLVRSGAEDGEHERGDLGAPCIDEEIDAGADERGVRGAVGRREEVRREAVGEELRDNGGLGDDLVLEVGVGVLDRGDQPALYTWLVLVVDHRQSMQIS